MTRCKDSKVNTINILVVYNIKILPTCAERLVEEKLLKDIVWSPSSSSPSSPSDDNREMNCEELKQVWQIHKTLKQLKREIKHLAKQLDIIGRPRKTNTFELLGDSDCI